MKRKLVSAVLVLLLLVNLGLCSPAAAAETEGAATDYFAANGLSVLAGPPITLPLTYIIYNANNPSANRVRNDGTMTVPRCSVTTGADGTQEIVLEVQATMQTVYEPSTGLDLHRMMWRNGVYDLATGQLFPLRNTVDNDGFEHTVTLAGSGETISYSSSAVWEDSGWQYTDSGEGVNNWTCTQTWTFHLPAGHAGLVFALAPVQSMPVLDNSTEISDEVVYALDDFNDVLSDTVFFRFGEPVDAFRDVSPTSPFRSAIGWAVENGITYGTADNAFSPSATCTRAQILTFLWRSAGSPESGASCPSPDIAEDSAFYKALCWAGEQGLMDSGDLAMVPCTRSTAVFWLWKLNATAGENTEDGQAAAPAEDDGTPADVTDADADTGTDTDTDPGADADTGTDADAAAPSDTDAAADGEGDAEQEDISATAEHADPGAGAEPVRPEEGTGEDSGLEAETEEGTDGDSGLEAETEEETGQSAGTEETESGEPAPVEMPFSDVDPAADYAAAVLWAVENGITTGTGDGSTFSPDATCNRGQIVTFLYRASSLAGAR